MNDSARSGLAVALTIALTSVGAPKARAESGPALLDEDNHLSLNLPKAWQERPRPPEDPQILYVFENPKTRQLLTITRVQYPNPDAWQGRDTFFAQVQAGLASSVDGFRKLYSKRSKIHRVPIMDIAFKRTRSNAGKKQREVVALRFLFFRTYTLTIGLATPEKFHRRSGRKTWRVLKSALPYFAPG